MKKLKIALTCIQEENYREKIDLAYTSAYLLEKGFEVLELYHCVAEDNYDIYFNEIQNFNPDIIGINMYYEYINDHINRDHVFQLCRDLKNFNPDIYICFGGIRATICREELLLEEKSADFLIAGESEIAFYELVSALANEKPLSDIRGLIYRDSGEIIINEKVKLIENLDILPNPTRVLLKNKKVHIAHIISSRGCSMNCTFCIESKTPWNEQKLKWRGRDEIKTVDEIESIKQNYGIEGFVFYDCSFEYPDISRMMRIADEIIKRNLNINYTVYVRSTFYKVCTHEQMLKLKKSGLVSIFVGIESPNQQDIKLFNKKSTVADNLNILDFIHKYDIIPHLGFINFNPYSTFERLHENAEYLKKAMDFTLDGVLGYRNFLYLIKNTGLYQKVKEDGLLNNDKNDPYGYFFENKKVGVLSNYLLKRMPEHVKKYSIIYNDFSHKFMLTLRILKYDMIRNQADEKVIKLVDDADENMRMQIKDFFIENNLFIHLLELAEKEWSETKADEIITKIGENNNMHQLIDNLTIKRNNLIRKLLRFDEKYMSMINNS